MKDLILMAAYLTVHVLMSQHINPKELPCDVCFLQGILTENFNIMRH